jgi:hypothetical protein
MPPISGFVSRIAAAAEGPGVIAPVDGGTDSGPAGRATMIVPAPPRLDHLVVPLDENARASAIGPTGPMAMTAGSSGSFELAIQKVFSVPVTGPEATTTVRGDDSWAVASGGSAGIGAGDVAGAATTEVAQVADITATSAAGAPPIAAPPPIASVVLPSPMAMAAPSLAASGGFSVATRQAGGLFLADVPWGDPSAVASLADPLLQAGVPALVPAGIGGQVNITFSVVGGGDGSPIGGFAAVAVQISNPLFIWAGAGDAAIQAPLPAPAIAMPGAVFLAPLSAGTGDASLRIVAGGTIAPRGATGPGHAVAGFEIGAANLVAFGPSQAIDHACRVLARDSALVLGGRGLAAIATGRDAHRWQPPDAVDTANSDEMGPGDAFGPSVPARLAPQPLGLMVDLRPFDPLAMGQTIDRFLERLELLGIRLASAQEPMDIAAEVLTLAIALTAWLVVPRMLRRPAGESGPADYDDATSLDGISGLAGGMTPEET